MYYINLKKNGYSAIKIPRYVFKSLKEGVLLSLNHKFKEQNFQSFQSFIKFLKTISNKLFIDKFGSNGSRILNAECTREINLWVKKTIPKKINCKKASINIIANFEYKNNNFLRKNQYSAFYRIVRKNKKDVGYPHRDSSFWKLGVVRKTNFKHKYVWKLWIPIMGVNRQNTLNMIHSSHKDDIKITYVKKNGQNKPKISKNYIKKNKNKIIKPIKFNGTEGVLFHSDTVHYANVNTTSDCRISVEFNILAK